MRLRLPNDNGGHGWFGTVQVGCDYQIGSNIVIGAFGDYDWSGIKGDMAIAVLGGVRRRGEAQVSWAAGGRIGWVPWSSTAVHGVRLGRLYAGAVRRCQFPITVNGVPPTVSLPKNTYDGWFIGTGYEYGLGFLPGLFWKTEYRFADYGNEHVRILRRLALRSGIRSTRDKYVHTVRSELVWRFNFGGPVVARY